MPTLGSCIVAQEGAYILVLGNININFELFCRFRVSTSLALACLFPGFSSLLVFLQRKASKKVSRSNVEQPTVCPTRVEPDNNHHPYV
jgi:hypothetical protein